MNHDSFSSLFKNLFNKPYPPKERLMETRMGAAWYCTHDFFIGAGDLLYTAMLFHRCCPRLLWWDDQYLWRDSRKTRDHWEGCVMFHQLFIVYVLKHVPQIRVSDVVGCIFKHLPPNINELPTIIHDSQEIRSLLEERDELVKAIAELQSQLDEVNLSNKASVKAWEKSGKWMEKGFVFDHRCKWRIGG